MFSGRVGSYRYTSGTDRVTLVINHEWEKDRNMIMENHNG
jgi:hypothetical protein